MFLLNKKFPKALIIDDNEDLCEIYREILSAESVIVDIATNLIEGERLILDQIYQLLIIDWNLNGHIASSLLSKIQIQKCLPKSILIITGSLEHDEFTKINNYRVLYKPFSFELLKRVLMSFD